MIDSTKALGIKVYQGGSSTGTALVKNVTYDGVVVDNCGVRHILELQRMNAANVVSSTPFRFKPVMAALARLTASVSITVDDLAH